MKTLTLPENFKAEMDCSAIQIKNADSQFCAEFKAWFKTHPALKADFKLYDRTEEGVIGKVKQFLI